MYNIITKHQYQYSHYVGCHGCWTLSELTSKQEKVAVLTHYMNTYVHKHQSWSSGILIMLGVLAVVGYICKV